VGGDEKGKKTVLCMLKKIEDRGKITGFGRLKR
jgi:hypothetical protein